MLVLPIVRAWLKTHSRILADFKFIDEDIQITIWDTTKKLRVVKLSPADQRRLVEHVLPNLMVILSEEKT